MKLYVTPGACSLSPHIVLRELGLDFSLERVDLASKRTASGVDFTALNPKGYVPALRLEDGEVLTEGVAIVQYLVDRFAPGSLAPLAGTVERARLQSHLNFISAELHKAFSPLFDPSLMLASHQLAAANVARCFDYLESVLADGRSFLLGESFSVADVYLFVVSGWAAPKGIDLARWPGIAGLVARVAERPGVRAAQTAEAELAAAA
jgi:glutathione S-transferase